MTNLTLKEQKELFVSGHTGTTPHELLLVCISAPIGFFLYSEVTHFLLDGGSTSATSSDVPVVSSGSTTTTTVSSVVIEAFVILLPMAICQTELLYPYGVGILVCETLLAFGLRYLRCSRHQHQHQQPPPPVSQEDGTTETITQPPPPSSSSKLEYLSYYRSTVSYLTFVAILAVDFTIFPRSFAKTETYGYGLMDLGAGSFVFSAGLVSWYAKLLQPSSSSSSSKTPGATTSTSTRQQQRRLLQNAWKRCLPLAGMGLLRLWTTKGLDYQEHVSEYGVHWNFFFTLCVVGVSSTMARLVCVEVCRWFGDGGNGGGLISLWVILLVGYQWALSNDDGGGDGSWQEYIEEGPRHCTATYAPFKLVNTNNETNGLWTSFLSSSCDLLAANREGVIGSIGYLILYLASEDVGRLCLTRQPPQPQPSKGLVVVDEEYQQGQRLLRTTLTFWMLHYISTSIFGIPVSRRSTNASFILWTIAHNTSILYLTWLAFRLSKTNTINSTTTATRNTPIFDALNRHGLIVFILANLMTGAVNLSMNTLEATRGVALMVIFGYLAAVGVVALFVDGAFARMRRRSTKDKAD
mmetsp:Transcript_16800/g.19958  ORF Transcript_16800/g.19958 Transcript_16800/m.19958 type:complete len:580 (-) Transcript_16800:256-1995(-)|eukprot:CAMPEP_0198258382 /NCGR_PEP_ID=MMETSP1447-20131203/7837_1 /TAXON_ID=420782 /ORGANISM="Chaetoceros dichaeta, Strain CCMP1751" /LENGTH=579 /DNA_ID=CAMNT_0043945497 /DNA_START=65 /DNA_END=1804 /DNA_ORIENTATION=-